MFAQAPAPAGPKPTALFQSTEFYLAVGGLIGLLVLAAVVLHFVDRWRRQQTEVAENRPTSPLDLTSFREMYENGEITQSEYERIRDKLAARMKKEVGAAGPPTPAPAPAPPQSAGPPQPPPPDGAAPPPAGG